jgi:hypothetical protein
MRAARVTRFRRQAFRLTEETRRFVASRCAPADCQSLRPPNRKKKNKQKRDALCCQQKYGDKRLVWATLANQYFEVQRDIYLWSMDSADLKLAEQ